MANSPACYPALGQRSATRATPDNFIPLPASLSLRWSDQCSAQQGHQAGWHQQGVKVHRGYSWEELGCVSFLLVDHLSANVWIAAVYSGSTVSWRLNKRSHCLVCTCAAIIKLFYRRNNHSFFTTRCLGIAHVPIGRTSLVRISTASSMSYLWYFKKKTIVCFKGVNCTRRKTTSGHVAQFKPTEHNCSLPSCGS